MGKVSVRLTIREEPFEVDEEEVPVLRAQRLLIENDDPAGEPSDPADPGDDGEPETKPAATARGAKAK